MLIEYFDDGSLVVQSPNDSNKWNAYVRKGRGGIIREESGRIIQYKSKEDAKQALVEFGKGPYRKQSANNEEDRFLKDVLKWVDAPETSSAT